VGFLFPLNIAFIAGTYLFYAQHNFEGVKLRGRHEWEFTRAALESSSYMPMGPAMRWFTGNIGYHHVHHLNSRIPFYRLPEAMAAIPELQHPGETRLRPRDVFACLSLKLWDAEAQQMVPFPDGSLQATGEGPDTQSPAAAP
jgi:omega-6 fatty acid desaturase (delta-12 desaturase)